MSKRADLTLTPHDPHRRRVIIAAIAGAVALVVLVGVGLYGLHAGPDANRSDDAPAQPGSPTSPPTPSPAPTTTPGELPTLPVLPVTTDPDAYSQAVAAAVFTWDTADRFSPLDYTAVVLAGADPSGEESAGLAADLALYLPTTQVWRQLTDYATSQTLTITRSFVPDSWAGAVESSGGRIVPGTVAVTIEGTRHRSGVWNGSPVVSERPVAFTVFVACPPAYDACHVLRLSELDNPLR
ncbi:hypothetical protein [Microbacterium tumbae]